MLERWGGSGGGRKRAFRDEEMGVEMAEMANARIVCDRLSVSVV